MKKVTLCNRLGETKEVQLDLSLGYLLLGPIYLYIKGMILRAISLTLVYIVMLWKGIFSLLKDGLISLGVSSNLEFLDTLDSLYWWLLGFLIVFHVIYALVLPRIEVKKLFKKSYVPYSEIDTQLLIKVNLAKVGTLSYLSAFKTVDGVQGKIKMGNSKTLEKELQELKELLKEGMITKDEYETKRAMAIMRVGKDKKKK